MLHRRLIVSGSFVGGISLTIVIVLLYSTLQYSTQEDHTAPRNTRNRSTRRDSTQLIARGNPQVTRAPRFFEWWARVGKRPPLATVRLNPITGEIEARLTAQVVNLDGSDPYEAGDNDSH